MGTQIAILLPEREAALGSWVVRQTFRLWEHTFSRFRTESELSVVNAAAGTPTVVSPIFLVVLTTALEAARATDGIFDPTLLPQLVAAGYDRPFAALDRALPARERTSTPGGRWRAIALDAETRTVLLPPGTGLDFGGIAKELAVDAALGHLIALGVSPAAVDAGGDLAVHGLPSGEAGWSIAVEMAEGSEVVELCRGALATSSVTKRRWQQGGMMRHHLLDPRSGEPAATSLHSVTVAAASCAQAGVAAKTALILGPERGAAFLQRHRLAGLLLAADGSRERVGNWLPEPGAVTA